MADRRHSARKRSSRANAAGRPFVIGVLVGGVLVWAALHSWHGGGGPTSVGPDPVRSSPEEYDWAEHPSPVFPIPAYARFLEGVTIVLDPGHIGQRDPGGSWRRGPTGLREAEINLRVAQYLRGFLLHAGARVVFTREIDESLDLPDKEDLRQRVAVANREQADLFLSIHHNGVGNPDPNYTSLFYHSASDNAAASACAARYLLNGLNDTLRLQKHLGCAVLSDELRFKNGLAVLREARVPAVLSEASFHSNPEEEARLRDLVYNRREAYGLFLGLARWAQAGLPAVALVEPSNGRVRGGGDVVVALDDGLSSRGGWGAERLRILPDSIVAKVGAELLPWELDAGRRRIRITLPQRVRGSRCTLVVDFENTLGQHVLHPRIELVAEAR